ncbi:hypothetical protein ZIOFF_074503 (mitochondrion) [Zingiber officinale]|uniref:Uncharacterized protein n=1 Tax=Zingiber officinale TaxID=94328 RepID=A0A8J5C5X0_ZINOF|nr:hypothetical protein ZIOFF_074503 [Zingiber officinale]
MLLSLGKDRVSVQLCFGCFAMDDSVPVLFRCTRFVSPTQKEGRGGKDPLSGRSFRWHLAFTPPFDCRSGMYPSSRVGAGRSVGLLPLKTVRAGLPACGSRHSRWPSPAFIRKSCSEMETARPRKSRSHVALLVPVISPSNDPASTGSSTVRAPFPPYAPPAQAYHASRQRPFRQTVFASSAILPAGCLQVTRSTVPRCEVQVVMITPGYALAPLTGTPGPANARSNKPVLHSSDQMCG